MPVSVHATITGDKEWLRKLEKLSPQKHKEIMSKSLLECGMLVQANAAQKQIMGGGQKAKGVQIKPHPSRLTSRTGTLRRSISTSWHRSPFEIDVGTHLVYGRVHELGLGNYPKRAFLEPAVKAEEQKFPSVFIKHWRRISGE
jgi:HK97 gp10 family phage protein